MMHLARCHYYSVRTAWRRLIPILCHEIKWTLSVCVLACDRVCNWLPQAMWVEGHRWQFHYRAAECSVRSVSSPGLSTWVQMWLKTLNQCEVCLIAQQWLTLRENGCNIFFFCRRSVKSHFWEKMGGLEDKEHADRLWCRTWKYGAF